MAVVYADMSQYARAEPLYRRCLAIEESQLGTSHPAVAETLLNLAIMSKERASTPRRSRSTSKASPLGGQVRPEPSLRGCGAEQPGGPLLLHRSIRPGHPPLPTMPCPPQSHARSGPSRRSENALQPRGDLRGESANTPRPSHYYRQSVINESGGLGQTIPRWPTAWTTSATSTTSCSNTAAANRSTCGPSRSASGPSQPPRRGEVPEQPGRRVQGPAAVRQGGTALPTKLQDPRITFRPG